MGTTAFPGAVDDFATTSPTNLGDDDSKGRTHSERHDDMESAMEAVQTWAVARQTVVATRTAGDVTLTTSLSAVDTGIDLVIPAIAGDVLVLGISAGLDASTDATDYVILEARIMVSSSGVRSLGSNQATFPGGQGTWWAPAMPTTVQGIARIHGSFAYTVVSGDISSGNVTIRLYGKVPTTGRNIRANNTYDPLHWWVTNTGQ